MSSIITSIPRSTILTHICSKSVLVLSIRGKKGSPAQSQKANRKDRDFRIKIPPGSHVRERQILATQKHLDYHPGLNALLDPRNNTIFALCSGTFYVSTEKVSPDLTHEVADKYYASRVGQHIHKRFINVIPEKPKQLFRMIDLV